MKAIFNDHLNVDPKKSMSLYRTAVYLNGLWQGLGAKLREATAYRPRHDVLVAGAE